jgi:hypothetical protein
LCRGRWGTAIAYEHIIGADTTICVAEVLRRGYLFKPLPFIQLRHSSTHTYANCRYRIDRGNNLNANTLRAVDTLYLRAFHQNLLADILQARISLKQHHEQAGALALAKELPPSIRQSYAGVAERLLPPLSALSGLLDDIEAGALSWRGAAPRPEDRFSATAPEVISEVISRLDIAEHEILGVLNEVGDSLAELAPSIISWDDCARLKTYVILERLAERPCYEEIQIHLKLQPFLIAEYKTNQRNDSNPRVQWPHWLVDEMLPIELLPNLDGVKIEMEARGEGFASCRQRAGSAPCPAPGGEESA